MLFWILVSILTAAVAAMLLHPLLRAKVRVEVPETHDLAVYRDQLSELKRDEANDLISGEDAEFARAEVARRLIAASDAVKAAGDRILARRSNRLAQAVVIVFLPAAGLGLYLATGSPDLPDAPLSARLADPGGDMNILIAKAEAQLSKNPDDGAGWDLLAPIYYRSGRIADAAAAFQHALRLLGPSPARLSGYAESLIALSGGLVTSDAQAALQQSLGLQPHDPRAKFYLALALKQQGKAQAALSAFDTLLRTSPRDAPWLSLVNEHIAELREDASSASDGQTVPGNPNAEQVAAAGTMTSADRQAMIEGMVESLAEKLKENPRNVEGWLRLIRSLAVLDRKDRAADALRQGLVVFPAESDEGRQLLALAGELGLKAKGDTP